MSTILTRAILIACSTGLTACATQGYPGPQLPDDQTAKVSLAAPSLAWLPPFWIFPLNLLPRLDEDWKNTVDYKIHLNQQELNRFDSISLLPGRHNVSAQYVRRNVELIGGKTCTSSDSKYVKDDRSESCTRTTSCKGLFKITEQEHNCSLAFRAAAGGVYKLAVNTPAVGEIRLSLRDTAARQSDQWNACYWTPDRSHEEYLTDTVTSDCSIRSAPPKPPIPDNHLQAPDKPHALEHCDHEKLPDHHPQPRVERPDTPNKHHDRPFNPQERCDMADGKPRIYPRKGKHEHPGKIAIDMQQETSPIGFDVNIGEHPVPGGEKGPRPDKGRAGTPKITAPLESANGEPTSKETRNDEVSTEATTRTETIPSASNSSAKGPKTKTETEIEKLPPAGIDPNGNQTPSPSNPAADPYSLKTGDSSSTASDLSSKDNTSSSVNPAPTNNIQTNPSTSVPADSLSAKEIATPTPSHGDSDQSSTNLPSVEKAIVPPVSAQPTSADQVPSDISTRAIDSKSTADSASNSTATSASFGSSAVNSNTTANPVLEPATTSSSNYSVAPAATPVASGDSSGGSIGSSSTSEPTPASAPSSSYSSAPASSPSANSGSSTAGTSSSTASESAPSAKPSSSSSSSENSSLSSNDSPSATGPAPAPTPTPTPTPAPAAIPSPSPEPTPAAPAGIAPAVVP